MTELTTEQLIYLLYAKAYTEADTVTKSTVKSHLPSGWKEKTEKIYDVLKTQKLVEPKTKDGKPTNREGRFSVTNQGRKILVTDLATTDYDFTSFKSYKVLNTLLSCLLTFIKEDAEVHPQINPSNEMTFDEFQQKFKALYFEERKRQELGGVVAIHKKELLGRLEDANSIPLSPKKLDEYFNELKTSGKIFISKGEKDELIHWIE